MTAPLLVPLESAPPHILVMDECAEILHLLRDVLREDGARVTLRRELLSLAEIRRLCPTLIIMERRFQGSVAASWMLVREIRRDPELAHTPIVLCTTKAAPRLSPSLQWELRPLDIHVLEKPFRLEDLDSLVQGARARNRLEGAQERPGRLRSLPRAEPRRASVHLEETHHEPALPDHGTPLPGWAPRRT